MKATKVESREDGIALLNTIAPAQANLNGWNIYAHLIEDDAGFHVEERVNRPCMGEMRRYNWGAGKGVTTRPHDPHPGDLPTPLGNGKVHAVALGNKGMNYKFMSNVVFHPEGAHRSLLTHGFQQFEGKDGGWSALWVDTKFDSTVLVNAARMNPYNVTHADALDGLHPVVALVLMNCTFNGGVLSFGDNYYKHHTWSLKKMFAGDANKLSVGDYFDNYDYHRPYLHFLFSRDVEPDTEPQAYDFSDVYQRQHLLNNTLKSDPVVAVGPVFSRLMYENKIRTPRSMQTLAFDAVACKELDHAVREYVATL